MVLAAQQDAVAANDLEGVTCRYPTEAAVVLAKHRWCCRRSELYPAVYRDREVDAEKWVPCVRNRIDVAAQTSRLPGRIPVEPLEREHDVVVGHAEPVRHPIRLQPCRVEDVSDAERARLSADGAWACTHDTGT